MFACSNNRLDVVKYFLENHTCLIDLKDDDG